MKKRLFCLLLTIVMLLSLVPATAFADQENDTQENALSIEFDEVYEGALADREEMYEDWYEVYLKAGQRYEFRLFGWQDYFCGSGLTAELFTPSNETLFITGYLEDASDDCFVYEPEDTGTYYLCIYNDTLPDAGMSHPYALTVSEGFTQHNFSSVVEKPTSCAEYGSAHYFCPHCGFSLIVTIPPCHSYTSKKVAATFSAKGYTLHTCKFCGDSYKDNYVAKKTMTTPTISSAVKTKDGITLKWVKIKNATGYYVYRSKNGGTYTRYKTISSGSTVTYCLHGQRIIANDDLEMFRSRCYDFPYLVHIARCFLHACDIGEFASDSKASCGSHVDACTAWNIVKNYLFI